MSEYSGDFPAAPPSGMASGLTPGTFGQRLIAFLIDAVIGIVLFLPAMVLFVLAGAGDTIGLIFGLLGLLAAIAWFVAWVFIYIVGQGTTGQTPGKRSQGLKLVGADTNQPIGGLMVFVRQLVASVLSNFCYIGHLWMLWDGEKKTLYDKILGNQVKQVPAGGVMPLFPDGKPF